MVTFSRNMLDNSNFQPISYQSEDLNKRLKSPRTALLWSAGATFIPMVVGPLLQNDGYWAALVIPAVLIGPSTGHFYANQKKRGLTTVVARFGLAMVAFISLACCT